MLKDGGIVAHGKQTYKQTQALRTKWVRLPPPSPTAALLAHKGHHRRRRHRRPAAPGWGKQELTGDSAFADC